jgi:hypothetical protein
MSNEKPSGGFLPVVVLVAVFATIAIAIMFYNARKADREARELKRLTLSIELSTQDMDNQIQAIVTREDRSEVLSRAYDNLRLAQERFNKTTEGSPLQKKALEGLEIAERQVKEAADAYVCRPR